MKKRLKMPDLIEAVAIHHARVAPPDEYGVHFINHSDKMIGWARAEHCASFEEAVQRALSALADIYGAHEGFKWKAQHDAEVRAYKVTHCATGEEKIIFRVTA